MKSKFKRNQVFGFRDIASIIENQMEEKMDNEMEICIMKWLLRVPHWPLNPGGPYVVEEF